MDDHYFETRFCDFDGAEVPPKRYRTLRWAKARAEKLSLDGCGSIWYQGDVGQPPLEMVRYRDDGVIIDVTEGDGTTYDDGTEYPLDGVPSIIEPGQLQFSLWLHDPDGKLVACYFGFDWDGEHRADWFCQPGDGPGPSDNGRITWAGGEDEDDDDQDLMKVEALDPILRGSWVGLARELSKNLISLVSCPIAAKSSDPGDLVGPLGGQQGIPT